MRGPRWSKVSLGAGSWTEIGRTGRRHYPAGRCETSGAGRHLRVPSQHVPVCYLIASGHVLDEGHGRTGQGFSAPGCRGDIHVTLTPEGSGSTCITARAMAFPNLFAPVFTAECPDDQGLRSAPQSGSLLGPAWHWRERADIVGSHMACCWGPSGRWAQAVWSFGPGSSGRMSAPSAV